MSYQIEKRKRLFTAEGIHELLPQPHIHSQVELIYLKKGKSKAVLDSKEYMIHAGEFFVAFPNQIHFYFDEEPVEGYMIIFESDIFKELRKLFQKKIPENPIFQSYEEKEKVCSRLQKICEKMKTEEPFDEVIAKGLVLTLLGEVFSEAIFKDTSADSDTIKRVLHYCMEHYIEQISLEKLSKDLYLSKYYISHLFHERMQMSFKDFINKLRVEYSCELLEQGMSVTEASYSSGFSSVRTYNRAFMKYKMTTPREYMKRK